MKLLPVRHARKGLGRGYLFVPPSSSLFTEPAIKRAVTFVDGQNLYRSAKEAFGYHFPNYDV